MARVHFLLLDHTDEHGAHKAIRKYHRGEHAHGGLHLSKTDPKTWGKDAMHAITVKEGFTCHDHIGDGPKAGYMVSIAKEQEEVFAIGDITPEDIATYRDAHESALAASDNYLGAWVWEGNVYLDVSKHITSLTTAMDLAQDSNQLGVYDIVKGVTIVTADYFKDIQNKAATRVFWSRDASDLAVVNTLRRKAGLPPLVHDTTGLIAKAALRLVNEGQ